MYVCMYVHLFFKGCKIYFIFKLLRPKTVDLKHSNEQLLHLNDIFENKQLFPARNFR